MIDGSQDGSSSHQRHYFTAPQLQGEQRFVISNTLNTRGGLEMEEEEEDYDEQQQQQQNEQELDTTMTNDEDSVMHTWESSRDHRKNIADEDDSVMVEEFDDDEILMHSDSVNSAVHQQKQEQKQCSPSQLSSNESSQTPNEQQGKSEEV